MRAGLGSLTRPMSATIDSPRTAATSGTPSPRTPRARTPNLQAPNLRTALWVAAGEQVATGQVIATVEDTADTAEEK